MKREGDKSLKCSNDPDDRISRLPDDILVHILCSMTIKKQGDATETVEENVAENNDSLLTRRWRYLSASLPHLDFSHTTLLDKSLIYYDECQMIQFCKRVKKFALSKQLKNLELDFNLSLGLYNEGWNYVFKVEESATTPSPSVCWSFVSFKSLNSLCFKPVMIGGDVLEGLLLNCPVLETLVLCNVSNLGCVQVVGPSLKLKHLEMVGCHRLNEIEIYDAPIVSMKQWWSREVTVRMNKVPQLVELSMSTCFKAADEISFFSSCLSQLESLKLRVSSLYDREHLGHNVLCLVTKLTKLRELEILFEPDMVKDLFPLVPLIEAPPHLHKIVIRVLQGSVIRGSRKLREVERWVGVLEHLKVLEFAGYRNGKIEDEFISCISNNAQPLRPSSST
ncbi:hypothetical protein LINPERPRIM_LOCUS26131 [Linum perenne]